MGQAVDTQENEKRSCLWFYTSAYTLLGGCLFLFFFISDRAVLTVTRTLCKLRYFFVQNTDQDNKNTPSHCFHHVNQQDIKDVSSTRACLYEETFIFVISFTAPITTTSLLSFLHTSYLGWVFQRSLSDNVKKRAFPCLIRITLPMKRLSCARLFCPLQPHLFPLAISVNVEGLFSPNVCAHRECV